MSHFSVLVISRTADSIGDALAPFAANVVDGDGRRSPHAVFKDETELYRKHYQFNSDTRFRGADGILYLPYDDRFRIEDSPGVFSYDANPAGYKRIEVPFRTLYATFDDYYASFGSDRDESGRYGFWHNPNWQWDYWRHGLRDEEDENSAFLQHRVGDGDPAQILKDWGWGFYAVVDAKGKWVRSDAGETDDAWLARCLAFIREAPVDYWFSAVMCHA